MGDRPQDAGTRASPREAPFDVVEPGLALAVGEDKSEEVGAELDRQFDVLGACVAANLDLRHDPLNSRTFASRSAARSSDSPTKTASMPKRPSESMSARLSIPLSLMTVRPTGISDRRRAVVALSVFIRVKSRLLIPIMVAADRSARSP